MIRKLWLLMISALLLLIIVSCNSDIKTDTTIDVQETTSESSIPFEKAIVRIMDDRLKAIEKKIMTFI